MLFVFLHSYYATSSEGGNFPFSEANVKTPKSPLSLTATDPDQPIMFYYFYWQWPMNCRYVLVGLFSYLYTIFYKRALVLTPFSQARTLNTICMHLPIPSLLLAAGRQCHSPNPQIHTSIHPISLGSRASNNYRIEIDLAFGAVC